MENGLLDHDHSEMDQLLAAFFAALETRDIEQSFKTLDLFWARLALHIRAEHLHLFPTLIHASEPPRQASSNGRAPTTETVQSTTAQLRGDHDFFMNELAAVMKQLRELRGQPSHDKAALQKIRERVDAIQQRLQSHNALEESQVYGWTDSLLKPEECVTLNERMQKELLRLPPRFSQA